MVNKKKNELRAAYDNAKTFYSGIVTTWKKDFISDADYQSFMRTYSFLPPDEVPQKFHIKIGILKSMISNHADLVRKHLTEENSKQLTLAMT